LTNLAVLIYSYMELYLSSYFSLC